MLVRRMSIGVGPCIKELSPSRVVANYVIESMEDEKHIVAICWIIRYPWLRLGFILKNSHIKF